MSFSYEWLVLVGVLALFVLGYAVYRLRAQSGAGLNLAKERIEAIEDQYKRGKR